MLEAKLPTHVTMDSHWWDHPLVPASLMEDGLDQNQFVMVCSLIASSQYIYQYAYVLSNAYILYYNQSTQ